MGIGAYIHPYIHPYIRIYMHIIRAHIKFKESDFYLLCLFVTIGMQVACYINAMILIFKVISEYCLLLDNIVVIVQLKCFSYLYIKKIQIYLKFTCYKSSNVFFSCMGWLFVCCFFNEY